MTRRYQMHRHPRSEIPGYHSILASIFVRLLLGGFILFPSTFTSIHDVLEDSPGKVVLKAVQYVPLIVMSSLLCAVGAAGMIWLWWRWSKNHTWLMDNIFGPGLSNSFLGLLTTLINVYTAKGGLWSITAKITGAVAASCTIILLALYLYYQYWVANYYT